MSTFELAVPVNPTADHVIGASHAALTIVEYGDFECPHCRKAAPVLKLLLAHFAGRARLVYRHFPLEEVHPQAMHAAFAAEAAGAQKRFWPMHDLLFEYQNQLKLKQLRGYAERLELDMVGYDAAMEDGVYLQRIREHMESGRRGGVRATPTFFINGAVQDVSFGLQSLRDRLETELGSGS